MTACVAAIEDSLPALVWSLMPDGAAEGFNRCWASFSGLAPSELEERGWLEAVHPADRAPLLRLNDRGLPPGPRSADVRIRGRDGDFCWFLVHCDGSVDPDSLSARRSFVALPIHARKLAEQARERAAADLDATLQHIPTMIWRTAASGEMDYANGRYLAAWGQPFEQVKGWGWKDSVHPDDRRGIVDYWASHLGREGDGVYEFRAGTPETGYRWYLSTSTARRDDRGEIVNWYGATFDIEDRKQAEERLRRSEAFLKQAQLVSKTGSVGMNLVTGEPYWSDETYRILEIDRSAAPSFQAYFERVHPEDRELMSRMVERCRQGERDIDVEHRLVMPDGRAKQVRVLASPAGADYGPDICIGAIMDITEAKLAQESAQQAHAELARVTRIATVAELAASIAHEVNQPLAAILMYGEACLRWMGRPQPDLAEAKGAAEKAVAGARRARDVVARLRAVFTRRDPEPVPLSFNDLVETTLPLLQPQVSRYRAAISLDLAGGLPMVMADPVQMQQVLINLVSNGLQSPPACDAQDRRLRIATAGDGEGGVVLSVCDDGQGIPEDHLARLFQPFFTTKTEGMGMGLSICRTIVESHRGRIAARNEAAGGATVSVTLPAAGS